MAMRPSVGAQRSDLQHYSYDDIDHHVGKARSYSDIFVREARRAGRRPSLAGLVVRPPWRFFRGYVVRLGFLDGWQGFVIAWMSALMTFLRYAKLRESALPGAKDRFR